MSKEAKIVPVLPGQRIRHEEGNVYTTPGGLRGPEQKVYLSVEFPADGGQSSYPGYRYFRDGGGETFDEEKWEFVALSASEQVSRFAERYRRSNRELAGDTLWVGRVDVGPGEKAPEDDGEIYPGISNVGRY